jgi:hypothetical protein
MQSTGFLARMVEQVCHVDKYRKSVQRSECRVLSPEEAALEWVDKHAARFPDIGAHSQRGDHRPVVARAATRTQA